GTSRRDDDARTDRRRRTFGDDLGDVFGISAPQHLGRDGRTERRTPPRAGEPRTAGSRTGGSRTGGSRLGREDGRGARRATGSAGAGRASGGGRQGRWDSRPDRSPRDADEHGRPP